jgi:hypothetical protein
MPVGTIMMMEARMKTATIPISNECNTPVPLLGHGLVTHRTKNYLSNAVTNLLEGEFWKGVADSGNRKGCAEMMGTSFKNLSVLLGRAQLIGKTMREESRPGIDKPRREERGPKRSQFLKGGNPELERY